MNPTVWVFLVQTSKHTLVRAVVGCYLLYLALSILVISPFINWQAGQTYLQLTGRPLHFEAIHFNPFNFSLTLREANDKNPDGSLLWSVQRVYINISLLDTLFQLTPTIDEITIEQPQAHAQRITNTQWNFDDILQHQRLTTSELTTPAQTNTASIPRVVIHKIGIILGNFQFTDHSVKKPLSIALDNLSFNMENFSTLNNTAQPYLLRADIINADSTKTTGELLWQGNLALNESYDQGLLAIKNIAVAPFWPYTKPLFNFTLHTTNASVTGQYKVIWKNSVDWSIQEGQLLLDTIGLTSGKKTARNAEITASQLILDNINIHNQPQSVNIAAIKLDGLQLSSWSEGADSGLIRTFVSKNTQEQTDTSDTATWLVNIETLTINKAAIDWRTAELDQHSFKLRKLNLNAGPIDLNGNSDTKISLSSTIDKAIKLSLHSQVNLKSFDGTIVSEIQNFPLTLARPLITPHLNINNISGLLNAHADIKILNATPIHIKTQGNIADMKLHPVTAAQELLTWRSLDWNDADINLSQQQINIPKIVLSEFDGRLIITEEGKTNLQDIFPEEEPQATSTTPWQFRLDELAVDKASFRFHDESLTPNFTAAVQNFSGTLKDLSSTTEQAATFSFQGDVDNYAPVRLQGKTQPFLDQSQLDAQLDFENLDLGGFSGYSSTYAGWRIERGLLTANLHYRLNEGLIEGDNHIEMDQLQLGEKVHNTTAKDIPLRLALALITDENGIATLDIGVSGKTDDPNFNVSKVIWSAVRNTFKKIVKSPFKLLGKLVGTKEDLGELPFNSGSSKLLATATRKLNALQQAMNKRPELRIELRGSYDPVTDTRGLQTTALNQTLLSNGLNNQDIKNKNQRWKNAITREYRNLNLEQSKGITPEQMHEQLVQAITIPADALTQLASVRSINAKQFLVQHLKIDNNRVLINASQDCDKPKVCNRRLVKLDLSDISQISVP